MSDRIVLNITCFQKQKKLNTLNNIAGLLKGVLFDLHARNFVHAKISLRARCVYARLRARNLSSPASLENKEVEPVEPVQTSIYQSNTYRKDLSWLHFNDELRVQERQQMKDQQSCISVFVVYPTIPSSN